MRGKILALAVAFTVGISGMSGNAACASQGTEVMKEAEDIGLSATALDDTEVDDTEPDGMEEGDTDNSGPDQGVTGDTGTLEKGVFRQTFGSSSTRKEIQKAFDKIKNGTAQKVEVTLEGNIQIQGRLIVYSNTTVYAHHAVITQTDKSGSILKSATAEDYGNIPHNTGYRSTENIKVYGGSWNGSQTSGQVLRFVHATNVLLEGLTVTNCTSTGHLITFEGVDIGTIQNCTLIGHEEMGNVKEAIHLDIVHSQKTTPGLLESEYDDLPDRNIVIKNNTILNSANGVGSHAAVDGIYHQNITIIGNVFDNIRNTSVRLYNYKNVIVAQNAVNNSAIGIRIYTFLPNGYAANAGVITEAVPSGYDYNLVVRENWFTNIKGSSAVYVLGSASRPIYNCKIEGNVINGAAARGVWLSDFCMDATVTGNTVNNAAAAGICAEGNSNNARIERNTVFGAGKSGITVTRNILGVVIKDNKIQSSKGHGIWVYDKAYYVTVSGNTVNGAEKNGIYVSSQSAGVTVKSNKVKGNVGQYGISVSQNSSALLENNSISSVKKHGIFINDKSVGTMKKNKISKAQQHGIYVHGSSWALMEKNSINSVKEQGIYVNEKSAGTIQENHINKSGKHGICINQNSTGIMKSNVISHAKEHGILVSQSNYGGMEKNKIKAAGKNGITVSKSGGSFLRQNTISNASMRGIQISASKTPAVVSKNVIRDSGDHGISISDSVKTEISNNKVSNVKGRGINLGEGCKKSEITKNRVTDTRQQGICSYKAAYVIIADNTVSKTREDGISAGCAKKFLKISRNKVAETKGSGINVWTVKKASIKDNVLENVGKIAFQVNATKSKVKTTTSTSVDSVTKKKSQVSGKARTGSKYSVTVGKKKYKVGVKNGTFETKKIKKLKKGTKVKVVEKIAGGNCIQTVVEVKK